MNICFFVFLVFFLNIQQCTFNERARFVVAVRAGSVEAKKKKKGRKKKRGGTEGTAAGGTAGGRSVLSCTDCCRSYF